MDLDVGTLNKVTQTQIPLTEYEAEAEIVELKENRAYLVTKRVFDFTVALVLSVLLVIPMLFIALGIRLDSPGRAIFTQERLGKNGKKFTIYKFRTMKDIAPHDMATKNIRNLEAVTTHFGKLLRKTSADELPQIFNVLKGDMSLVGYRPVCLTEKNLNYLRARYGVFSVRPGITGYAQINGRDNLDDFEKAKLDAFYVQNQGIKMDTYCLIKTVKAVISQDGVK